jgi:predicted neutral ceramidase superfamily lipid hydrolase
LRKTDNDNLLTVLSLSFLLGMAVAVAVYFAWRLNVGGLQAHGFLTAIALIVCPPFVLSLVIGPIPDSDLALVLVVGTIVFANAFLYAGVAAGGYFIFTLAKKKKERR